MAESAGLFGHTPCRFPRSPRCFRRCCLQRYQHSSICQIQSHPDSLTLSNITCAVIVALLGILLVMNLLDRLRAYRDQMRRNLTQKSEEKNRGAREKLYIAPHGSELDPLPLAQTRPLTLLGETEHEKPSTCLAEQSSCSLLSLPAEIRNRIWEYTITGRCIALYRDRGRLTHGLLDGSNTRAPGDLVPITPESIRHEVLRLANSLRDDRWDFPPQPKQANLTALLKTCRSM